MFYIIVSRNQSTILITVYPNNIYVSYILTNMFSLLMYGDACNNVGRYFSYTARHLVVT